MTNPALQNVLEDIYTALRNDNEDLDKHIVTLKSVMQAQALTSVEVNPSQLIQPNRQGRKLMQSYFKQRGVIINFAEKA